MYIKSPDIQIYDIDMGKVYRLKTGHFYSMIRSDGVTYYFQVLKECPTNETIQISLVYAFDPNREDDEPIKEYDGKTYFIEWSLSGYGGRLSDMFEYTEYKDVEDFERNIVMEII